MNVYTQRGYRIPFKTTSCSVHTAERLHALPDHAMCHSDLYAYIKVFGNESQRIQLVNLKSKTRRLHLLPLYRQVKCRNNNNNNQKNNNNNNNQKNNNKFSNTNESMIQDSQEIIDSLEEGHLKPNELYAARETMPRNRRAQFDQLLLNLMKVRRFRKKATMEVFVKLGKFRKNAGIRATFSNQERNWFDELVDQNVP
jgi:hypothetical protein